MLIIMINLLGKRNLAEIICSLMNKLHYTLQKFRNDLLMTFYYILKRMHLENFFLSHEQFSSKHKVYNGGRKYWRTRVSGHFIET